MVWSAAQSVGSRPIVARALRSRHYPMFGKAALDHEQHLHSCLLERLRFTLRDGRLDGRDNLLVDAGVGGNDTLVAPQRPAE